ncbi:MAG: hypothetical protein K2X91_12420, partial [Thermoleophilia bacterium]|nr:hypothetical protein [Thermoleophilia bacterium]
EPRILAMTTDRARSDSLRVPSGAAVGNNAEKLSPPREITQNSPGLDGLNARDSGPVSDWAGNAAPAQGRAVAAARRGIFDVAAGGSGHAAGEPPAPAAPPNTGGATPGGREIKPEVTVGEPAAPIARAETTIAAKPADLAAPLPPPPPTAEVALGVSDVYRFYNEVVPQLVNRKEGEDFALNRLLGPDQKDITQGVDVQLRVNENRLPRVLEQLKQTGQMDVRRQATPKEVRLAGLDASLKNARRQAATQAKENAATPQAGSEDAGGEPRADGPTPGADIDALTRRREQIAREGEFATLNIIALPEQKVAQDKASARADAENAAYGSGGGGAQVADPPTPAPSGQPQAVEPSAQPARAGAPSTPQPPGSFPVASAAVPTPAPAQPPAPLVAKSAPLSDGGKLRQAAREGLSSLGDSTAALVRDAIATSLYWVPALVLAAGLTLRWRRRRAAATSEPPPLAGPDAEG